MSAPIVGVVLTSFNRPAGLERAIASMQWQEHREFMCVIADDHSEDPRVCDVLTWAERDPRFRRLTGHRRFTTDEKVTEAISPCVHINRALDWLHEAGCDYFCYLLDDVVYHPARLAAHVRELEAHPDVYLVWGEQWLVRRDAAGTLIEERKQVVEEGLGNATMNYVRERIRSNSFINHCSLTHRRLPVHVRWPTHPAEWQYFDWRFCQRLVREGANFRHIAVVGETMHSGPDDIGPILLAGHQQGKGVRDSMREVIRRRSP